MRRTVFSPCRRYRYVLWREWTAENPAYVLIVGLNPSVADETDDDPTIRRCVNYAKEWNYGALCMVNLFAFKATKPAVMKAEQNRIGPDNDRWISKVAKRAGVIVAAWGIHGAHLNRDEAIKQLLVGKLTCLRKTKRGHPSHPLYLKKTLTPFPYS